MTKRLLFLLVASLLLGANAIAQNPLIGMGIRSTVEEIKNGRKYFVHTVKPGETLYSIAKTYHLPMQDIAAVNNNLLLNLKVRDKIRIPVKPLTADEEGVRYYFFFIAEKKMSLYQAAKHYKFDVKEFLAINPQYKTGIKRGDLIKVPKERVVIDDVLVNDSLINNPTTDVVEDKTCMEFVYDKQKTTFKVVMLLPLLLGKNDHVYNISPSDISSAKFNPNTSRFIEYVEGVLLAANNLRKEGINIELRIYDTENSVDRVAQLMRMGVVDKVDLVLGPVYSKHFLTVAEYLKGKPTNLVSPLSQNTRLLSGNENAYLLTPSVSTNIQQMSNFIAGQKAVNVLVVHTGTKREIEQALAYKVQLTQLTADMNQEFIPSFKMVNFELGGISAVREQLDGTIPNMVIVPSSNEVFVTDFVAKINTLALSYPIEVVGLKVWENFKNLTMNSLHELKVQYATNAYLDYKNERITQFTQTFRNYFRTEPTPFAFQGYDAVLYFGKVLKRFGPKFGYCLSQEVLSPSKNALSTRWNFVRTEQFSGYENRTVYIIKYEAGVDQSVHRLSEDFNGKYTYEMIAGPQADQ